MIEMVYDNTVSLINRYINLPIEDWAWSLVITLENYIADRNANVYSLDFNICKSLTIVAVEDLIKYKCSFYGEHEENEYLINYIMSQSWFSEENEEFYDYLGVIVSHLHKNVVTEILSVIPVNNVSLLELKSIKDTIYYIENKGDFRIVEYYRLMNKYEPENKWKDFLEDPTDIEEKSTDLDESERLYQALELKKFDTKMKIKTMMRYLENVNSTNNNFYQSPYTKIKAKGI